MLIQHSAEVQTYFLSIIEFECKTKTSLIYTRRPHWELLLHWNDLHRNPGTSSVYLTAKKQTNHNGYSRSTLNKLPHYDRTCFFPCAWRWKQHLPSKTEWLHAVWRAMFSCYNQSPAALYVVHARRHHRNPRNPILHLMSIPIPPLTNIPTTTTLATHHSNDGHSFKIPTTFWNCFSNSS